MSATQYEIKPADGKRSVLRRFYGTEAEMKQLAYEAAWHAETEAALLAEWNLEESTR